jgi:hypothetical protein
VPSIIHSLAQAHSQHQRGDEAERQIDPEDRGPAGLIDQERAHHRPEQGRAAEGAGYIDLHARAVGTAIDVADQRHGDRHDGAGAETLQDAKEDQPDHAAGEAAQQRAEEEEGDAEIQDALAAVEIGEAPIERHRHRLGQEISGKNPAEEVEAAERADNARHRRGDDGALDRRHEDGGERRRENPAP